MSRSFNFSFLVAAAPLLIFGPILFGHPWIPRHDSLSVIFSIHHYLSAWKFEGAIPEWSPYRNWGVPNNLDILNNFSPPMVLLSPLIFVVKNLNVVSLFYAGLILNELVLIIGTYALSSAVFRNRATAIFVSFALGGTVFWVFQIWFNFSFYYGLPLCLYCFWKGAHLRRPSLILLGVALMEFTTFIGGFAYASIVLGLIGLTFLPACLWTSGCPWKELHRGFNKSSLLALLLCVVMVSIPLNFYLNGWSFGFNSLGRTKSGWVDYATFLSYNADSSLKTFSGLLNGLENHFDSTVYGGLLMVPLALLGIVAAPSKRQLPFLSCALLIFLFWMGADSFLAPLLYFVPGVALFRSIGLVTPLIKVMLAFMAGFGFDALVDACRPPNKLEPILFGLGGMLLVLLAVFLAQWKTVYPLNARSLFVAVCYLSFLVTIVTTILHPKEARSRLIPVLLSITFIDVASYRSALYHTSLVELPARAWNLFDLRPPLPVEKRSNNYFQSAEFNTLAPFLYGPSFSRERMMGCTERGEGCREIRLSGLGVLYGNLDPFLDVDACKSPYREDIFNSNVLVVQRLLRIDGDLAPPRGVAVTSDLNGYLKNPTATAISGCGHSKFQVTDGLQVIPDSEMGLKLTGRGSSTSLVALQTHYEDYQKRGGTISSSGTDTGLRRESAAVDGSEPQIALHRLSSNRVDLEVSPARAKDPWLYYADAWHPFWKAYVNGVESPILEANGAFKAVHLPAHARSTVEFIYSSPTRIPLLMMIFLLSVSFMAGVIKLGIDLLSSSDLDFSA